ncbi:MAG: trypsin-like peptidase domain-containing protein [Clostridia bacterium]|nr:trypsin-like peptidase domain-containing protein [Clostridia bacterium]MBQ8637417.1 trypsin-like peptidase domain-containing protein [Clostridia bacterium]
MSYKEYSWQQNELGEYSYVEVEKRKKLPSWLAALLVSAVVCTAFLVVYSLYVVPNLRPNTVISHSVGGQAAPVGENAVSNGFVGVGERISESIVSIPARTTGGGFFGQRLSYGGGSGVVVSSDGYILTSVAAIESGAEVLVRLADGTENKAKVEGVDNRLGLAILKVDKTDLKPVEFADSSALLTGTSVAAIGRILGSNMGTTMSVGTVCGIDNGVTTQNGQTINLVQTDSVKGESTGTAIIDNSGKVVGFVTGLISSNVDGIEFAIPSNDVVQSIESLINIGTGTTGLVIGIQGIDTEYGVAVEAVNEGSAAEKGGMKVGDLIIKADGNAVKSVNEINKLKAAHTAGDIMTFTIYRDGEELTIEVKLG